MSRRHSRSKESKDNVTRSSGSWRPIRLIQVDVDTLTSTVPLRATEGDRLWIEVVKRGQVVGVVDACVENGGVPAAVLEEMAAAFKDVDLSSVAPMSDEMLPMASVVVPTLCRNPAELVRTVTSLLALDYPDFEIIIVDNRSGGERSALPEFPGGQRVRVFEEPKRGASVARNKGIAMATGEFLAFTDDDAVVSRDWLRVLGTRFTLDAEVEAIGGLVLPMELETAPQLWFEEFYGGFSPSFHAEKLSIERLKGIDDMFPYAVGRFGAGCNMAYRRSTLQRIGGFDINIGGGTLAKGGEDVGLAIELVVSGGTFAYEPAAVVRHTHRRLEEEFMSQVFNYGTGLTAMYTALIVRDPRHLVAIIRRIPVGFRHLTRPAEQRSPSSTPSYPRRTLYYQLLGMVYGPLAYVRSVARTRWFS